MGTLDFRINIVVKPKSKRLICFTNLLDHIKTHSWWTDTTAICWAGRRVNQLTGRTGTCSVGRRVTYSVGRRGEGRPATSGAGYGATSESLGRSLL